MAVSLFYPLQDPVADLLRFVQAEGHRGYDPYDALNSPMIRWLTKPSPWLRMAATQSLRRLPVNVRPILGIKKGYNPKGMGLFLSSYVKLFRLTQSTQYLGEARTVAQWLVEHSTPGYSGYCWGYNFDWQSRAFYLPKGTPTAVNTAFIGHAFLDAYDLLGESQYLEVAEGAARFILSDLNRYERDGAICFSYTPLDSSRVHNANYLAASLLARTAIVGGHREMLATAESAYEYSNRAQTPDGAWPYGEAPYQRWVDGFHTGFNLEAVYWHHRCVDPERFKATLARGLRFYLDHLFLPDGTPKYYHDRVYPIDIHCAAQALVVMSRLKGMTPKAWETALRVLEWTLDNMRSPSGAFFFRRGRFLVNRTPYMRWGQAWMLHALTTMLWEERN
ncbi:MAG: hypothetical protein HYU29_01200 [Chloroflexi bacterium]|nr:hypothetical protein [Chloroflexota bacterium]